MKGRQDKRSIHLTKLTLYSLIQLVSWQLYASWQGGESSLHNRCSPPSPAERKEERVESVWMSKLDKLMDRHEYIISIDRRGQL
jgi:hypothetical protein